MTDNELKRPLRVHHRKDGKINLFIYHPVDPWSGYKATRNNNKALINTVRKLFPHVMNEFREIPSGYDENGWCRYRESTWCCYGMTKTEYVMLKLSWTFKEKLLHTKTRKGVPVKKGNYYDAYYAEPTKTCKERWANEKFRQKLLPIT